MHKLTPAELMNLYRDMYAVAVFISRGEALKANHEVVHRELSRANEKLIEFLAAEIERRMEPK